MRKNMLDMNRAKSNQMHVFEPVVTILYRRGDGFDVIIDSSEASTGVDPLGSLERRDCAASGGFSRI
jgi:hypothetical protein